MGISGSMGGGGGDMRKTTYDPNDDGVIALAELDTDVVDKPSYDTNDDGVVDNADVGNLIGAGVGGLDGRHFEKIVSANLRNSHDGIVTGADSTTYTKEKTFTITDGVKGILTVKFDIQREAAGCTVYGAVYKNGVLIGTPQDSTADAYETKSENIDFGSIQPGETIELWTKTNVADGTKRPMIRNFRLYYDNVAYADIGVAVTDVTS